MTSGPRSGISTEDLTELALESAISLDRELRRAAGDRTVVTNFLNVLGSIVNVSPDQTIGHLISDPRKVGIVNRAFRHLNRETVPTIEELIAKIKLLSDSYRGTAASRDDIARLRDFCIVLHKELLAHAYRSYDDDHRSRGVSPDATGLF
ncbi:MAG: hypothetical protein JO267_02490 [Alphaproteobacteria bacterium]|nr:hypothetical protein [Alphaproteobacteria bacterium]